MHDDDIKLILREEVEYLSIIPNQIDSVDKLTREMAKLANHSVFARIQSIESLRVFMEWHVFAVWDFMSLVKRLQCDLTCVQVPWVPPQDAEAARLINEIVLGEESDEDGNGGHISHFELYLAAMEELGADTTRVRNFVQLVKNGADVRMALCRVHVDPGIARFVSATMDTVSVGDVVDVLGSFFYGRESVIPEMFRRLLSQWGIQASHAPTLTYYLERHIEVDEGDHAPAALRAISRVTRGDPVLMRRVQSAGLSAVSHRAAFWDALEQRLK